jgi:hypothetical protein
VWLPDGIAENRDRARVCHLLKALEPSSDHTALWTGESLYYGAKLAESIRGLVAKAEHACCSTTTSPTIPNAICAIHSLQPH